MDVRGSGELLVWSEEHAQPKSEPLRACFVRILKRNGFEVEIIDGVVFLLSFITCVYKLVHDAMCVNIC